MDSNVCDNYRPNQDIQGLHIGYVINSRALFLIIPGLSIITNICVLISFLIKTSIKNKKQASMEKMLHIITLIETAISVYWLISAILFYQTKDLYDNCVSCFTFSLFSIFLYMADIIFLTLTIHNLMKIMTDPIEGILKPNLRLNMYLLFTLIASALITMLSYMAKVYGRSPMLTCFIRTDFDNVSQNITLIIFLIIPCAFFVYSLYLALKMCCNRKILHDSNLSKLFYKYMSIIMLYFILKAPMILLFSLSIKYTISTNSFLSWLSFTCAVISISIPLIITLLRLCQGYVKIDFFSRRKSRTKTFKGAVRENLINDSQTGLARIMTHNEKFEWLEKKVLETFFSDIFIGICSSLKKAKVISRPSIKTPHVKMSKKECLEINEMNINAKNIKFTDDLVRKLGVIDVKFTEYAPKVFHQLRMIDHLDEEDLIESLLPMKNRYLINKSEGKSGNFFICTDDNKYILKTINQDELELIRGIFLKKYSKHLRRYPNSLICRIYGLYKMHLATGTDVLVILMQNVIGQFKNNVICKYDLKGSIVNRKTSLETDSVNKIVMKDLNFDEIEKCLVLGSLEQEKLKFACTADAYFLSDMDIMDYSLFVVKVSLNPEEIEAIFGKKRESQISLLIKPTVTLTSEESFTSVNFGEEPSSLFKCEKDLQHYRKYIYRSLNENVIYIIAIIDYLQIYNFYKYLETNLKFYIGTRPEKVEEISCVPPDIYCIRFIDYVKKITEVEEKSLFI